MKQIIFAICIIISLIGSSQNQTQIDSLENVLNLSTESSEKIPLIIQLSKLYKSSPEGELYAKSAYDLAKKQQNIDLKINALQNLSDWNYNSKKFEASLDYLTAIKELLTQKNDSVAIAKIIYREGNIYRKNGQLDLALTAYQSAILILERKKEYESLCNVLNKAGITQKDIENYPEALKHYYKAYDIAVAHKYDKKLASTCTNIGVVLKRQKNYREALKLYDQSKEIHTKNNDYSGLANVYNNIGNIHRKLNQVDSALTDYKTAIFYREKSGTEKMLSYSYNNIAISFSGKKMYDSALFYLKISEDYKIKNESRRDLASTYLNYAEIYGALNDSEKFEEYYSKGIDIADEYNDTYVLSSLLSAKSKIQANNGNFEEAYKNLLKVIELSNDDKLDKDKQKLVTSVLNAQFKDKNKTLAINSLEEANEKLIDKNQEINLQKDNLKKKDKLSFYLIVALIGCAIFLITFLFLLFQKNKKLATSATNLKQVNKALSQSKISIEEKETLIKEVHHRVKNNLQIIKSLVRLQKNNIQNETTKSILSEFELRVSSMALVHESLYKSDDLSKVNINAYYEKLIHSLIEAYSVKQTIETNIKIEVEALELDTLIPLGLLTNEIISNALKHGLRNKENGKLLVQFYLKNDSYHLTIADNGPGFPIDMEEASSNSLGMELIDALVQQLDGEVERNSKNGAEYRIKFKKTN